jgi:hypothetical protein
MEFEVPFIYASRCPAEYHEERGGIKMAATGHDGV